MRLTPPSISMRWTDTNSCKTGAQSLLTAFAPRHIAPSCRCQTDSHLLHGNRLVILITPQQRCWTSLAFPGLLLQRSFTRLPHGRRRLHADHVGQSQFCDCCSKLAVVAIRCIRQHGSRRCSIFNRFSDLLQRDLGFVRNRYRKECRACAVADVGPNLEDTIARQSANLMWPSLSKAAATRQLSCLPSCRNIARCRRSVFLRKPRVIMIHASISLFFCIAGRTFCRMRSTPTHRPMESATTWCND